MVCGVLMLWSAPSMLWDAVDAAGPRLCYGMDAIAAKTFGGNTIIFQFKMTLSFGQHTCAADEQPFHPATQAEPRHWRLFPCILLGAESSHDNFCKLSSFRCCIVSDPFGSAVFGCQTLQQVHLVSRRRLIRVPAGDSVKLLKV